MKYLIRKQIHKVLDHLRSPRGGAFFGTTLVLLILLFAWQLSSSWYEESLLNEKRAEVTLDVSLRGNALASSLERRFNLVEGLFAFAQTERSLEDIDQRFDSFAAGLYASTDGIRNLALAPGGTVQFVYPLVGNESVLGYSPITDPRPLVRADVARAMDSRRIILSGPVELVQGGVGLIARQAVYKNDSFWGFVNVVVDLSPILDKAGLVEPGEGPLAYALRDEFGNVFQGNPDVFRKDPAVYRIQLMEGYWELAGAPVQNWQDIIRQPLLIFQGSTLAIVLLLTGLTYLSINRQARLSLAVQERTDEILRINLKLYEDITERMRAEAALRASEARIADLLQLAADAIIATDEEQRITIFNKSAESMFGYAAEEILGQPLDILLPHEFIDVHRVHVEKFAQSADANRRMSERSEVRGRRKDGSQFPAEASISKQSQNEKLTFTAIVRDITHRKKAEAELREREEQYRSIFESVSDALFINDMDGNLVDFNPAAYRMHGYSEDEFRQLSPSQFVHPDYWKIFEIYMHTVREGGRFRGRAMDVRKDGTPFHVEVLGTGFTYRGKAHALGVVRDVSEEAQAFQLLEKRVQARTRELSTLLEVSRSVGSTLELSPLLALILDSLKEVVEYATAAVLILEDDGFVLLDQRGVTEEIRVMQGQFGNQSFFRQILMEGKPLIIPDVREDTPAARSWNVFKASNADAGEPIQSFMAIPLMVKEEIIGVLVLEHEQANYYNQQQSEYVMAFANQAAVAIENARLYEQAQQLAALQERQKLARELHDSVSQALFGIGLGARTARTLLDRDDAKGASGPLDYVLSLAEAGLAEMRALIFELRPESLEVEGLVAALSKHSAALAARYQIQVSTEFCDEPPLPLNVKQALYRVSQEAMNNIVKHANASQVQISLKCDPEKVAFHIQDNGRGFDPEASFPGHLGLHSMRERVERQGGAFNIRSAPGKGTSIDAEIPIPNE